jgi:hypothetical protein
LKKLRHRQGLRWLALFALAVQFVLSLGHIHLPGGEVTGLVFAQPDQCPTQLQSCQPSHQDEDPDACPICLATALVGSSVIPQPPTLPSPDMLAGTIEPEHFAQSLPYAFTAKFRARAPPRA